MARKRRMKSNVFVKPNEQNRACSSYAMARKRAMKWKGCASIILSNNKKNCMLLVFFKKNTNFAAVNKRIVPRVCDDQNGTGAQY